MRNLAAWANRSVPIVPVMPATPNLFHRSLQPAELLHEDRSSQSLPPELACLLVIMALRSQYEARGLRLSWRLACLGVLAIASCGATASATERIENDDSVFPLIKGEQRHIRFHDPDSLPGVYVPPTAPPPTVREPLPDDALRPLPLDEAIRMALSNSVVVRQLAGAVAVSSGRTIYDPAITNTTIDQQRAAFDPNVVVNNTFSRVQVPTAFDLPGPGNTTIISPKTQNYNLNAGVTQRNLLGGTSGVAFGDVNSRFAPGFSALNPQNAYATELSYTQPLLRGAGVLANRVPIVLARIDTERSFFALRDSVQELVRGVIDAYWQVVFARTDVWAREIQVKQAEEAFERATGRREIGIADITETAQARAALANFRASLIASRANLLTREAALAGILGMPPTEPFALLPVTPPTDGRVPFDWNQVVDVAQMRRPDLIELKLVLEADQQNLVLARNQQQPNLDLVALYRWNGLEGTTPDFTTLSTNSGEATDWTVGVNFSVPLFLRAERASVRSAELLLTRDRAALEQGVQTVQQVLANNFRNLDQFYMQYEAFTAAREAAKENLERQFAAYQVGVDVVFLNVLQAISDWGNSVSQQAQALTQYNIELANLERETGTILETHAIFLFEDRFCRLGPLWIDPKRCKLYPEAIHPSDNAERYPAGDEASEQFFDLDDYPQRLPPTDEPLPYPAEERLPEERLPETLPSTLEANPNTLTPDAELAFPPSIAPPPTSP
jgi:outer membrane protein TolC